jgi:hypothetical protein
MVVVNRPSNQEQSEVLGQQTREKIVWIRCAVANFFVELNSIGD